MLLQLYLHFPFCKRKCFYCDFCSAPADDGTVAAYCAALKKEICLTAEKYPGVRVSTVFLGGGTPTLVPAAQMRGILEELRRRFDVLPDAEITAEGNPGTLSPRWLEGACACGLNRLSLGMQAAQERLLKAIGRIHTFAQTEEAVAMARAAGIRNLNVDLMSALPGQSLASWERSLREVTALEPEHISAYSLIVEEGTPFCERYSGAGAKLLPDEDTERAMYRAAKEILGRAGFERYEISNYAKPGRACRHNIGYWNRTDYLGIGLGASSLIDPMRWKMTSDLSDYLECGKNQGDFANLREEVQTLRVSERMEEFMFLGLRLTKGIELQTFEHQFGKSFWDVYQDAADKLFSEQLLCLDESKKNLRLTDYGVDVSNYALAEFLLDQ